MKLYEVQYTTTNKRWSKLDNINVCSVTEVDTKLCDRYTIEVLKLNGCYYNTWVGNHLSHSVQSMLIDIDCTVTYHGLKDSIISDKLRDRIAVLTKLELFLSQPKI